MAQATIYHVSSSEGDDSHSGSLDQPLASLSALNALSLQPGDTVLFKAGDSWTGMFWPKGSGTAEAPIVIDRYGAGARPILDGDGYQAAILLYNEDHIVLRNLELTNEASHLDEFGVTKKLDGFGGETNSWGSGRDVRFGVKVVADGRSLDHFRMDSLFIHDIFPTPVNDNFVHQGYGIKFETRSNTPNATSTGACSLFDPGPNASWPRVVTVTTPDSVDSGASQTIGLHVTALPLSGAYGRIVRTLADGSWYNGPAIPLELGDNLIEVPEVGHARTVRMQVSSGDVGFDALTINDGQLLCDGTELDGEVRLISDVLVEGCEFERTGHYAIWVKSLGLVGIDAYKNEGITVRGCGFLHTGGSGFVPNKSRNVLVEGCTFNHTGSSQDDRMWKRGSGLWPFDCQDVVIQENRFLNAHGPGDSYGAHIDYGNENVVLQYN
ncbi:MAG: right-handed parallel beta-helix repeat-containing protein, partial [Bacteroidota bacterium]|nr:right-handed parallel beta-helix repeat-containing protein [Bacteroidota bacterium]